MRVKQALCLALLFSFGTLFCLYCGARGFNPLDQSIVFDGGWRVLSGQVPFRDFSALTGTVPSVMQAVFFKILGVNWFAYCLHAAVLNGLFSILVFATLRIFHLRRRYALLYGLLSGTSFYAPMGTPYMEQHGFFFLLVTLLLLVAVSRARTARVRLLAGILAAASFLAVCFSKQNVALFSALPCLTLLVLLLRKRSLRPTLMALFAGAAISLAGVLAIVLLAGISLDNLTTEFLLVPLMVTSGRGNPLAWILEEPFHRSVYFISLGLSSLSFVACAMAFGYTRRSRLPFSSRALRTLAFAASLEIASILFVGNTLNQHENGLPFLFLSLGLVQAAAPAVLRAVPRVRHYAPVVAAAFALIALLDARQFAWYDRTRSVQDIFFSPEKVVPFATKELQFLHYQVWPRNRDVTAAELDGLIGRLRRSPGNFFLIGDFAILYGLTGKPSPLPSLWFHTALTSKRYQESLFPEYEQALLNNLHNLGVQTIVLEPTATMAGISLATFPNLRAQVATRTRWVEDVGVFKVVHLSGPF